MEGRPVLELMDISFSHVNFFDLMTSSLLMSLLGDCGLLPVVLIGATCARIFCGQTSFAFSPANVVLMASCFTAPLTNSSVGMVLEAGVVCAFLRYRCSGLCSAVHTTPKCTFNL